MSGLAFVLLTVGCLVAAGLLAVARNERTPERLRSEQRRVLLATLLNLVPGLGLWLVVKRPKAALLNMGIAALAVALILFRHDFRGYLLWLEVWSAGWAYSSALRKAGLTEKDLLDASRSK